VEEIIVNDDTKKVVKKQIDRLVECLERITLALQSIDVTLERLVDKPTVEPLRGGDDV